MNQFTRRDLPVRVAYQQTRPDPSNFDTRHFCYLVLLPNKWDDFGYSTMFYAYGVVQDTVALIGRYRILIEGSRNSAAFIEKRAAGNRFEFLTTLNRKYLGLAEGVDFYRRCRAIFQPAQIVAALKSLHDASILRALTPGAPDLSLEDDEGFQQSLLRGSSERQALERGASVVRGTLEAQSVERFTLAMQLHGTSVPHQINFDFSERLLPHNINVLIGINGTGKTRALEALIDCLVNAGRARGKSDHASIIPFPSFDQVISVSFSPYEKFFRYPEDRKPMHSMDEVTFERESLKTGYVYAGLRDGRGRFRTSVSETAAIEALCLLVRSPDTPFTEIERDAKSIVVDVLREAFSFDYIEVSTSKKLEVGNREDVTSDVLFEDGEWHRAAAGRALRRSGNRKLIFRNAHERIYLSAGQKQFVYMALILMGRMRDNSILVVDEPELYLHPALEVILMRLLKDILQRFDSYAVIATHSSIILREVPSACVSVLKRVNGDIIVRKVKIETFGADVSKIANEVFDDIFADAPYEEWLRAFAVSCGSFKAFRRRAMEEGLGNKAILYVRNSVFLDPPS